VAVDHVFHRLRGRGASKVGDQPEAKTS
jgi:hypothetical protein